MTLVDDLGRSIPLGLFSPSLVGSLVRDGYLRMLERDAAAARGIKSRLCYDVVRECLSLRSKKFTALQKARIRAFSTEAFMTAARAESLGYLIEPDCVHCGARDTIFHRIWECPFGPAAKDRQNLVEPEVIEAALSAKATGNLEEYFVFISGAFRHPADSYPRALTEQDDGPTLIWHQRPEFGPDGAPVHNRLWGDLFVDGSCMRHTVRELSRAASSVCMIDKAGDLIAELRAPVWSPYPQTPQSAEFSAFTWSNVMASHVSDCHVFSDCSNVVNTAIRDKSVQLSPKRMYAGAFLQCHGQCSGVAACTKVAAHLDRDAPDIPPDERWRRRGNHHADVGAKMAVLLHPRDDGLLQDADRLVAHARATLRLAANLLVHWPPLDLTDVEREPHVPSARPPRDGHVWQVWGGIWRCAHCLRGCRSILKPSPGSCPRDSLVHAAHQDSLGHRTVAFPTSDGAVLFICLKCKCHSSGGQIRGLAQKCLKPSRAGRYGWDYVCKGLHPQYKQRKAGVHVLTEDLIPCFNAAGMLAADDAPSSAASVPAARSVPSESCPRPSPVSGDGVGCRALGDDPFAADEEAAMALPRRSAPELFHKASSGGASSSTDAVGSSRPRPSPLAGDGVGRPVLADPSSADEEAARFLFSPEAERAGPPASTSLREVLSRVRDSLAAEEDEAPLLPGPVFLNGPSESD